MSETLVKVENVSKKFCKDLKRGLFYGVQDITREVFGKQKNQTLRDREFWAVNDVSFEINRGECLGLIGHNGAGKSSLLKILAGLLTPDKGKVELYGRVNALINLGAGFSPVLTGRENIYNNASVFGFDKVFVDKRFDDIVEFAELEEFIDSPVQYYSSGMKARLGFAVAAFLEPDVLILDEVLAVGDAGFKIKSFNKISELMQSSAVIFVSHSMPQIARICDKVLFLNSGSVKYYGEEVSEAIEMYYDEFEGEKPSLSYSDGAEFEILTVNNLKISEHGDVIKIQKNEKITFDFRMDVHEMYDNYILDFKLTDKDIKAVAFARHNELITKKIKMGDKRFVIEYDYIPFTNGEYSMSINLHAAESNGKIIKRLSVNNHCVRFKVNGTPSAVHCPVYLTGTVK